MIRPRDLTALAAVAALAASCARRDVGEVDARARAMIDGHAEQARRIGGKSSLPSGEAEFIALKGEIGAKAKEWEARLQAESSADSLFPGARAGIDADAAAKALAGDVSMETVLRLAAARSPEIQSARENWRAALRRFDQASYLEDLVARYRAFVRELDTQVGPQTHKEMLSDTFPFPSALALKGEMADLEAEAARLEYRGEARRVLNEVARRYLDAVYLGQAVASVGANARLFAQMEEIAQAQLQSGRAPQSDALLAQSERAMIDAQLATLQRERENAMAEINTKIALPAGTKWGGLAAPGWKGAAISFQDALKLARAENQELLKARVEARAADVAVRMAETMIYPRASQGMSQLSPGVGAEAGPTRAMMAAFPEVAAPDASRAGFGADAAWIDELRVRAVQARRELETAEAAAEFGVKDALFQAEAARREFEALRGSVAPKTGEALSNVQSRYSAGSASFVEYLEAARANFKATLDRDRAGRDLNQSRVAVEDAMGRVAIGGKEGAR